MRKKPRRSPSDFSRKAAVYFYASIALLVASVGIGASIKTGGATLLDKRLRNMSALEGEKAIQHLKQQGLYASLAEAMRAARYSINLVEQPGPLGLERGSFYANNPTQSYRALFTRGDMRLVSQAGSRAWQAAMRLVGYGYGGRLKAVGKAELQATAARIEYQRKDELGEAIVEWYENRPAGLEQGFTITAAPMQRRAGERLVVGLELSGDLQARVNETGRSLRLENPDGAGVLSYDRLVATDAAGRVLEARMRADGSSVRLEVDDAQAKYPVTIDPIFSQQQKLTASDATNFDAFGGAVAISGETAVVGAPDDDNAGGMDAGAAYVFVRTGATWSQQQKLTASDGASFDHFGGSVAIDGDTVVVGAPDVDNITGVNAGAAYVFVRTGTTWSQQQKLTGSDTALINFFGSSVAISGDTAVIGSPSNNNEGGLDAGAAYVFVRTGTTWSQQQKLRASDAAADDHFGAAVASDGETVVVGARGDVAGTDAGAAYVFVKTGTTWSQQQKLTASDAAALDSFGIKVAIDGGTIVVGAPYNDNAGGTDAGAAYVFIRTGTTWSQQQKLTASDGARFDNFGNAVAISGETAVIGSPNHDTAGGANAGAAYVFVRTGATWSQQQSLTASDGAAEDRFGVSVAIDGETLIVGAPFDNNEGGLFAGAAYVFVKRISCLSIACPGNITQGTDPDRCGAVVNYVLPKNDPDCGTITCSPASGSVFSVGTTTVTCASPEGPTCSFTVTIKDDDAPLIICPANVATVAPPQCPGVTSAVVNFPPPTATDNCAGVTTVCNPPSGSTFPVGTTSVSCTATDAAGNMASCGFAVTVWSGCLQDESNPANIVLFNSRTGDYQFCCNGAVIATGTGTVTARGCVVAISHTKQNRRLQLTADLAVKRGTATVVIANQATCQIIDQNMANNNCLCPASTTKR